MKIGHRVIVFAQTDSTNSRALEYAGTPDGDGLAFLADEQLAGRGQHGRRWLAAPKSSVLLSVLLHPPETIDRPVLLTAWAAVSVCELAERLTGIRPRIKWPNDVLLHGRKVCGILIEQSRQAGVAATVAGIGLNVTQPESKFAAAGLPEATSLLAMGAVATDTHAVAHHLLGVLDETYQTLLQGDLPSLEAKWSHYLGLVGADVVAECHDETRRGRLDECGFDRLLIRGENGSITLRPEAIRHIHRS